MIRCGCWKRNYDRRNSPRGELSRREAGSALGGLGRAGGGESAGWGRGAEQPDTLAAFYQALATDALVRSEADVYDLGARDGQGQGRGHGR